MSQMHSRLKGAASLAGNTPANRLSDDHQTLHWWAVLDRIWPTSPIGLFRKMIGTLYGTGWGNPEIV